jgi:hypothetical protein
MIYWLTAMLIVVPARPISNPAQAGHARAAVLHPLLGSITCGLSIPQTAGPKPDACVACTPPTHTRTARQGSTSFSPCCCATTTSPASATACASASTTARASARATTRASASPPRVCGCCACCCANYCACSCAITLSHCWPWWEPQTL